MGEKLQCFSTRWLTPTVNKMAASRTGLQTDKDSASLHRLNFTSYLQRWAVVHLHTHVSPKENRCSFTLSVKGGRIFRFDPKHD